MRDLFSKEAFIKNWRNHLALRIGLPLTIAVTAVYGFCLFVYYTNKHPIIIIGLFAAAVVAAVAAIIHAFIDKKVKQ